MVEVYLLREAATPLNHSFCLSGSSPNVTSSTVMTIDPSCPISSTGTMAVWLANLDTAPACCTHRWSLLNWGQREGVTVIHHPLFNKLLS